MLQSDSICSHFDETQQTIMGMFLQNTYEVYWTISPMGFLERMYRESEHFWDKHHHQLSKLGLTQQQKWFFPSLTASLPAETINIYAYSDRDTVTAKEAATIQYLAIEEQYGYLSETMQATEAATFVLQPSSILPI